MPSFKLSKKKTISWNWKPRKDSSKSSDTLVNSTHSSSSSTPASTSIHTRGIQRSDFRDRKHLGRGACGSVTEADHLESDQRVAFKTIRGSDPNSPEIYSAITEKKAMMRLKGVPGMLQILGAGSDTSAAYIATEAHCGNYEQELEYYGRLDRRHAVHRFAETIVLIERAHSRGVVHRDIKAANMLVAKDGSLVLGDMGLARVLPEGQHVDSFCSRTRIGTPDHMAPEVIGGLRYGAGCDRWSAAVDFYVALTGKLPFEDAYEELPQMITVGDIGPRFKNPNMNVAEQDLFEQLFAFDSALRPTFEQIKAHCAMRHAPWAEIESGTAIPPAHLYAPLKRPSFIKTHTPSSVTFVPPPRPWKKGSTPWSDDFDYFGPELLVPNPWCPPRPCTPRVAKLLRPLKKLKVFGGLFIVTPRLAMENFVIE